MRNQSAMPPWLHPSAWLPPYRCHDTTRHDIPPPPPPPSRQPHPHGPHKPQATRPPPPTTAPTRRPTGPRNPRRPLYVMKYFGPSPPCGVWTQGSRQRLVSRGSGAFAHRGGVCLTCQLMSCAGALMSQVLQWMQLIEPSARAACCVAGDPHRGR